MHLAAVLKVPLVAIFGPGYIKRYDPSKLSDKAIALHSPVECAPCDRHRCRQMKCLEGVSVHEVVEASLKLLNI
jgi:ADP-heptose:LPS heptosyltransferase